MRGDGKVLCLARNAEVVEAAPHRPSQTFTQFTSKHQGQEVIDCMLQNVWSQGNRTFSVLVWHLKFSRDEPFFQLCFSLSVPCLRGLNFLCRAHKTSKNGANSRATVTMVTPYPSARSESDVIWGSKLFWVWLCALTSAPSLTSSAAVTLCLVDLVSAKTRNCWSGKWTHEGTCCEDTFEIYQNLGPIFFFNAP